jgi:large-conductance mechanosensitive channel
MVAPVLRKVFAEFQEFAWSNNFLAAASGVAIGVGTKELIEHLMKVILLPLITWVLHASFIQHLYSASLDYVSKRWLTALLEILGGLAWALTNYVVLILLTFFILEYVIFRKVIGLKSVVPTRSREDFLRARDEAQKEPLVPSQASIQRMEAKQAVDDQDLKHLKHEDARKVYKATHDPRLASVILEDFLSPLTI